MGRKSMVQFTVLHTRRHSKNDFESCVVFYLGNRYFSRDLEKSFSGLSAQPVVSCLA